MKLLRAVVIDLCGLAGVGVFLHGLDQVYRPAALMVGGLLAVGMAVAASAGPKRPK